MSMKHVVAATTLALAAAVPAQAGVIFSDTFDTDSATTVLNFNSLINWTVSGGTIDYLRSGGFGITCVGSTGGCLDMDGSTSDAGRITSRAVYTFDAGVNYALEAMVSGNQRGGANDSVIFGLIDTVTMAEVSATFSGITPSAPFGSSSYSWAGAGLTGSYRLFIEGVGGDNVGVILDNVVLRDDRVSGTVPEPGSLALLGLGLLGLAATRRRLH